MVGRAEAYVVGFIWFPISGDNGPWGRTMSESELLGRITSNPAIFAGKPIIRGMRISVELILSLLSQGESVDVILEDYPDLRPEDIQACYAYALTCDASRGSVRSC